MDKASHYKKLVDLIGGSKKTPKCCWRKTGNNR